jgi:hypothetical protein
MFCGVTTPAQGKDGVIHGLGTHLNNLNRAGCYGLQSALGYGIRSGGKTDAVHLALFNKPLGFIQKGLPVRFWKAEKIPPIKGHLDRAAMPPLEAKELGYRLPDLLQ